MVTTGKSHSGGVPRQAARPLFLWGGRTQGHVVSDWDGEISARALLLAQSR